jgi:hypothetical protein
VLTVNHLITQDGEGEYVQKIRDMIGENSNRLVVDINDMRRWDAEIARRYDYCWMPRVITNGIGFYRFLRRPSEYIKPFEAALEQVLEISS